MALGSRALQVRCRVEVASGSLGLSPELEPGHRLPTSHSAVADGPVYTVIGRG